MSVLYICDPEKNGNCPKTICAYLNQGECRHTRYQEYRAQQPGTSIITRDNIKVEFQLETYKVEHLYSDGMELYTCKNCGTSVDSGDVYCKKCGFKFIGCIKQSAFESSKEN